MSNPEEKKEVSFLKYFSEIIDGFYGEKNDDWYDENANTNTNENENN